MRFFIENHAAKDEYVGSAWGIFLGPFCLLGLDLIRSKAGFILSLVVCNIGLGVSNYR